MEVLTNYWPELISGLVALFGLFKFGKYIIKYVLFAKEVGDVYISYDNGKKNGVFTDEEKIGFANEILEAIESGKNTFKKEKK